MADGSLAETVRSRLRSHGAELGLVAAGQLASAVGTFAAVKALTTLLPPEQYGELALAATLAAFAHVLAFAPLMNAQARFLAAASEAGTVAVHLRAMARLGDGLSIGVAFLGVVGAFAAARVGGPRWAALSLLAAAFAVSYGGGLLHGTALGALRERGRVAALQALDALVRPGLAVLAVLLLRRDAVAAQLGATAGALLSFLAYRAAARAQPALRAAAEALPPHFTAVRAARREMVTFALPFVATALLVGVASYGDRWSLEVLLGPADVGVYTALFQIGAAPPALLAGVLSSFALPLAYQQAGALSDRERTRSAVLLLERTALFAVLLALPWIALCWLFGGPLLRLLSSPLYASRAHLLWLFAVAGTALGAGQIVLAVAQAVRRPNANLVPWTVNAALTLGLSLALGRVLGLPGVAAALVISNGAHFICSALLSRLLLAGFLRDHSEGAAAAAAGPFPDAVAGSLPDTPAGPPPVAAAGVAPAAADDPAPAAATRTKPAGPAPATPDDPTRR